MSTIEGIDKVLAVLEPHWAEIEAEFNNSNARYLELAAADHDAIGRVLRSHLLIEHYMDSFLESFYKLSAFDEARLSFYQKAILLPRHASPAAFVRSGILELNALRNKFGHRLNPHIAADNIEEIYTALRISGRKTEGIAPIAAIEIFTPIACTFLSIGPKRIQELFAQAFAHVRFFE